MKKILVFISGSIAGYYFHKFLSNKKYIVYENNNFEFVFSETSIIFYDVKIYTLLYNKLMFKGYKDKILIEEHVSIYFDEIYDLNSVYQALLKYSSSLQNWFINPDNVYVSRDFDRYILTIEVNNKKPILELKLYSRV